MSVKDYGFLNIQVNVKCRRVWFPKQHPDVSVGIALGVGWLAQLPDRYVAQRQKDPALVTFSINFRVSVDSIANSVFVKIGWVGQILISINIRTKDPNNNSDSETGTLSNLCLPPLPLSLLFLCSPLSLPPFPYPPQPSTLFSGHVSS